MFLWDYGTAWVSNAACLTQKWLVYKTEIVFVILSGEAAYVSFPNTHTMQHIASIIVTCNCYNYKQTDSWRRNYEQAYALTTAVIAKCLQFVKMFAYAHDITCNVVHHGLIFTLHTCMYNISYLKWEMFLLFIRFFMLTRKMRPVHETKYCNSPVRTSKSLSVYCETVPRFFTTGFFNSSCKRSQIWASM